MNIDSGSEFHSTYRRSVLEDNDGRSTDRLNIKSDDDDGKKSAGQNDVWDVHSRSDGDGYLSTVDGKDPEGTNGRSADACTTATDDGACVIEDSGGWITVEKKRRKYRMIME